MFLIVQLFSRPCKSNFQFNWEFNVNSMPLTSASFPSSLSVSLSSQWGYFIAAVEWLVFVCTHGLGAQWKSAKVDVPWIVQKVMEKSKNHKFL